MAQTVFTPSLEGMEHVKAENIVILTKPFLDVCKKILPVLVVSCVADLQLPRMHKKGITCLAGRVVSDIRIMERKRKNNRRTADESNQSQSTIWPPAPVRVNGTRHSDLLGRHSVLLSAATPRSTQSSGLQPDNEDPQFSVECSGDPAIPIQIAKAVSNLQPDNEDPQFSVECSGDPAIPIQIAKAVSSGDRGRKGQ